MKKTVALITVVTLIITIASVPAFGASVIDKGQCGDNAYWTLTSDGTLTISGTGEMWDFNYGEEDPPYMEYLRVESPHPIKHIVVKNGITRIGNRAFGPSFISPLNVLSVKFPDTCTSIGEYALSGCQSIKKISIPRSVTTIGKGAFCWCDSITTLTIPEKVTVIESSLVASCRNLKTIYIGSRVLYIRNEAFNCCYSLKDVYYSNTKENWQKVSIGSVRNDALSSAKIHYTKTDPNQPSSWAKKEIQAAIDKALVPTNLQKGYGLSVSREDVMGLFIRLIEDSIDKSISRILTERGLSINPDVFEDTSSKDVLAANALGIINGTGENIFSPNGTLTRAQAAAILNRIARLVGVDTSGYSHNFTDVSGHWVESELGWPVHAGIIKGVGNGKFAPDKELTTEEAIVIVYRTSKIL